MDPMEKHVEFGGKRITFQTGKVAKQAAGSVWVTGGGTAVLVTAQGAKDVGAVMVVARQQYENQVFSYAGPCGDYGFVEDYTAEVRGVPTRVIVLVTYNAAGQTQRIVVNHRPRSALLSFSRLMLEKFAGTPLAKHWEGTP